MAGGCYVSGLEAADVSVTWDPPDGNTDGTPMNNLAGYRFYWGEASHSYSSTVDVGSLMTVTVRNLQQGHAFFFTVSAYNSNGNESVLAEEWMWTLQSVPPDITSINAGGIPPVVSLTIAEKEMKMGIWGTVGADLLVQANSNLANPLAWEFLKNLTLTNVAPSSNGTPPADSQNTLETAFVPALEWFTLSIATSCTSQFFRVVMPYNYAVLADKVLKSKGYQTKLIVVRLPGETLHDVCYVGKDAAYIDCSENHYILALNYSGATIREIADDYGGYVNMNWTSASEFVFTNGVRQIVSTVVKTDSPSSDPQLASTPASSIEVDF
jgi:hypothetical protein